MQNLPCPKRHDPRQLNAQKKIKTKITVLRVLLSGSSYGASPSVCFGSSSGCISLGRALLGCSDARSVVGAVRRSWDSSPAWPGTGDTHWRDNYHWSLRADQVLETHIGGTIIIGVYRLTRYWRRTSEEQLALESTG